MSGTHLERARAAFEKRSKRLEARKSAWRDLKSRGVESFVGCVDSNRVEFGSPVLTANQLSEIYTIAEKVLVSGGRMSLFCSTMDPLVDLYAYIKDLKNTWTCVRFEEMFVRKITVSAAGCL